MTTLSSLNAATTLALAPLVSSVNPTAEARTDASSLAALSSSTVVTIPSASGLAVLQTYTPEGTLAGTAPVLSWASDNSDIVSLRMMANYAAQTMAGHFAGLGSALLDRFKTTGGDYAQSISIASASGLAPVGQGSNGPDGQIGLTIRTKSGVTVEIELGSEDGGLSVSIKSSGTLGESERAALAKLSDGFQQAIDGLSAVPPKLDLSGLAQFDTSALASVNFHYSVTGERNGNISASYSQDSSARSPEDGFTQMNEDYGAPSGETLPGAAYSRMLQQSDQAMLTGLADFSASITDTSTSPNPMRPGEVDSFSYQVA
ncbi:hypothetical protein [Paraburkholderia silvatlantica]|uniref:hypothetical protein n=1 Tax=Paraburkholderia silvatlantica TaxID=321895 RepID=UPI0037523290